MSTQEPTTTTEQTSNGSAQAPAATLDAEQVLKAFGYLGDYEDPGPDALCAIADDAEIIGMAWERGEGFPDAKATSRLAERARIAASAISQINDQRLELARRGTFDALLKSVTDRDCHDSPWDLVLGLIALCKGAGYDTAPLMAACNAGLVKMTHEGQQKAAANSEADEIKALQDAVELIKASVHRGYFGELGLDLVNLLDMGTISLKRSARYVVSGPEAGSDDAEGSTHGDAQDPADDDPQDRPGVLVECNWDDACQAYLTLRELITPEVMGAEKFASFDSAMDVASDCLSQLKVDYGPYNGGVRANEGIKPNA